MKIREFRKIIIINLFDIDFRDTANIPNIRI